MAKKKAVEAERVRMSVWVMADDLRRADALALKMGKDRMLASMGNVTRSTVLRHALTRGLDALEREYR